MNLQAMSDTAVSKVTQLGNSLKALPPVEITTQHVLHAGLYARTICIPANTVLASVLIRIPTLLVLDGDAEVYMGDTCTRIRGRHVIPAYAHRKTAYFAHRDTHVTMLFATTALTVDEAEREFTDEHELLFSRHGQNDVLITEVLP